MKLFELIKNDPVNNYFIFDKAELEDLKKSLDKDTIAKIELEIQDMFDHEMESVITKNVIVPSDDINDYCSLASYWWPNPDTADGLPYIQKDGYINPEGDNYDKNKFRRLALLVYCGGLMYYITEDKKYYELIKKHLNHWFIDSKTRMNPHMEHGQFIPGVNKGRKEGIIDYTANFAYALHILTFLHEFNMLEDSLYNELVKWHIDFKKWLITSEIGVAEGTARNNHGIMYYFGLIVISEFINDTVDVDDFIEEANIKMLSQVDDEYKLPLELARTKSKSYTLMCFKGLYDIEKLSKKYKAKLDDKTFYEVAKWLIPFYSEQKPWEYTQVVPYDKSLGIYFVYCMKYRFDIDIEFNISIDDVYNKVIYYLWK